MAPTPGQHPRPSCAISGQMWGRGRAASWGVFRVTLCSATAIRGSAVTVKLRAYEPTDERSWLRCALSGTGSVVLPPEPEGLSATFVANTRDTNYSLQHA